MSVPVDKLKENTSTQMVFSLQIKRFPVMWRHVRPLFSMLKSTIVVSSHQVGTARVAGFSPDGGITALRRYTASSAPLYSFLMLAAL